MHFEELKKLARRKREFHDVDTASFGLRDVRKIYKKEGITIDHYPLPYKIKALYMCANGDYSVAIQKKLPEAPKLFALVHELKHHYTDQELLRNGFTQCGDHNRDHVLEVGAEVFAAEFIYPQSEFADDLIPIGINSWTNENVVKYKREHCKAKVSYQYIIKRLEHLNLVSSNQFKGVKFQNLEDELYGKPYHRRQNISRFR